MGAPLHEDGEPHDAPGHRQKVQAISGIGAPTTNQKYNELNHWNMTKQIIFIFAVLCSLQARADVQPAQGDTVRYTSFYNVTELLQPMQPVYFNGVVLPMSRSGNWFVSITGGATAFLGTPLGCEDLFGRLKPSYSLAVGKWSHRLSVHE